METLKHYKRLPYTLYTQPQTDSDGSRYWTAEYIELRGCKTDGDSEAESIANLQSLFDEYIKSLLEEKIEIPVPLPITLAKTEVTLIVQRKKFTPVNAITEDTHKTATDIKYKELSTKFAA